MQVVRRHFLFVPIVRWLLCSSATVASAAAETPRTQWSGTHGFFDCSTEHVTAGAIKRAYRRSAFRLHPDKQQTNESEGTGSVVGDFAELRDAFLRDPMKFYVFRAMYANYTDQEQQENASATSPPSLLRSARSRVVVQDNWPYVELEMDVVQPAKHGALDFATWSFALALRGRSTIQYKGVKEEAEYEVSRGYDVCCDFLKNSRCERAADGGYRVSDCPFPVSPGAGERQLTFLVRKPLHLREAGRWGAAVQVVDQSDEGRPLVCVAFAFRVSKDELGAEKPGPEGPDAAGGAGRESGAESSAEGAASGAPGGHPPAASPGDTFRVMKGGHFCEDGGDILEGPLDNYGHGGDANFKSSARGAESEMYGGKCRARCAKRQRCRFYTIYSSGWCQLSSRCGALRPTGDPLSATFAKVFPGDMSGAEEL